ncbi:MAG: polysaccharide deacetylase family protein [Hydrogenophaga sp.]|uniref:polysaccharide deacetylase family protein n=1 Tax=Hydrogenophaga sp. TaxID=1904254 RepID=UPI001E0F0718|nr:polysaccharide deacetylase family protein [Hydrogenophaga sp.]MBX3610146.1 polysaccharide deacetylase family protein [Hydrogenophaga sp.]
MTLPAIDRRPAALAFDRPMLLVTVDTEEEFDWMRPFNRESRSTLSIRSQGRAHAVFERFGVKPTYVMNHPVATDPVAAAYLRGLVDQGLAEFGTHCHPWVTPPHDEDVSGFNSFHGNLPVELEAAKIAATTDAIAQAFGKAPTVFKAGRYGVGPGTFDTLRRLGYEVDCSFVPHTSFASESGPDFLGTSSAPFFVDADEQLLEIPLTVGFTGRLSSSGPALSGLFDAPWSRAIRLPGAFNRAGLLQRVRLTPEGVNAAMQIRLLDTLIAQGVRLFTMTYHSPSLAPGHTPYVRNDEELGLFVGRIEAVLKHFRDRLGGGFTTMAEVNRLARKRLPEKEAQVR